MKIQTVFSLPKANEPGANEQTENVLPANIFLIFDNMETANMDATLIDGYVQMLDNLSPDNKLDLISKLTASVKLDIANKKSSFKESFGAFESEKSADEIIDDIRKSRLFTREMEAF